MSDDTFRSRDRRAEYLGASADFDALVERLTQEFSNSALEPNLKVQQMLLHAHEQLLLKAPTKPTEWWPGGWVPREGNVTFVWRTEREFYNTRQGGFHRTVRWTPFEFVARYQQWPFVHRLGVRPVAFDASFWKHNTSPVHLKVIKHFTGAESAGIPETAVWVATATASGMLGNATYDAAKAAIRRLRGTRPQDSAPTTEPSPRPPPDRSSSGTAERGLEIDLPRAAPPVIGPDSIEP